MEYPASRVACPVVVRLCLFENKVINFPREKMLENPGK